MSNDVREPDTTAQVQNPRPAAAPAAPPAPLVILASDDDLVCVDDLCLPTDARDPQSGTRP